MSNKICIIVGHGKSKKGGYDSGALSKDKKYHEFKLAKEIAKYAQEELKNAYGADCDLMNYNGDLYLQERINKLKDDTYDFIAEIHLNAGGGTGPEVYYYHGSANCKKYADTISEAISKRFNLRNRGAKTRLNDRGQDFFGIIRETKPTSVLVETVFIDTDGDLAKVKDAAGQKACGQAIADGIAKVRGLEKKTPAPAPAPTPTPTPGFKSYVVRITCKSLNVRSGPGTSNKVNTIVYKGEAFTIVGEQNGWGKLKSGAGWISLSSKYVQKI